MINGKQNVKPRTLYIVLVVLIISLCIQSSSAIALPPFAERLREKLFPKVAVTITNDASRAVYLKCGFNRDGGEGSERLEPGEVSSTSFFEILFPLRWCYVHINKEIRGAFWAFTVTLQCTNCTWSIRDDGAYHLQNRNGTWVKRPLFLE